MLAHYRQIASAHLVRHTRCDLTDAECYLCRLMIWYARRRNATLLADESLVPAREGVRRILQDFSLILPPYDKRTLSSSIGDHTTAPIPVSSMRAKQPCSTFAMV
jgi:hypothetical protein